MVIEVEIGYINARIRGMKSRLFDRGALEQLISKPNLESLISELENTPYREDLERACVQHSGIHCIEEALRINLARTYRLIFKLFHGEPSEKYLRFFLNKWDIQNIKTIIRGKNIHIREEEILECLVPAGELDEVTLTELVKQTEIKECIDLLATWNYRYAKPLTKSFAKYKEKRDLAVLEYALDKFYYTGVLKVLKGSSHDEKLVRDFITTQIDIVNIKSVFRLIRDRIPVEDVQSVFLDSGQVLSIEMLSRMAASGSIKEAIGHLKSTPYSFLADIPPERVGNQQISAYEKELDRFLNSYGTRLYRGDPFSIALTIGYLCYKDAEITNLRIISRCKRAYLPDEEVKEELIYV